MGEGVMEHELAPRSPSPHNPLLSVVLTSHYSALFWGCLWLSAPLLGAECCIASWCVLLSAIGIAGLLPGGAQHTRSRSSSRSSSSAFTITRHVLPTYSYTPSFFAPVAVLFAEISAKCVCVCVVACATEMVSGTYRNPMRQSRVSRVVSHIVFTQSYTTRDAIRDYKTVHT